MQLGERLKTEQVQAMSGAAIVSNFEGLPGPETL